MNSSTPATSVPSSSRSAKLSYEFLDAERRVLEMVAGGAQLDETLSELIRSIERELPQAICAVLKLSIDRQTLSVVGASSMSDDVRRALCDLPAREGMGSCGTAIARNQRVVIEDVFADELGTPFLELARRSGIRSCWSQPIDVDHQGPLGTFAIMHMSPVAPSEYELAVIEAAAHLAGIALDRHRADAVRHVQLATFALLNEAVVITDVDGRIIDVNPAAERMWGVSQRELVGSNVDHLFALAPTGPRASDVAASASRDGSWHGECPFVGRDGKRGVRDVEIVRMQDQLGRITGFVHVSRDVTERRRAESEREALQVKLLQTQKLESLGILAGGIAHDFNNLLTGILGNAELALDRGESSASTRAALRSITGASQRAADLTRQMLAYAGKATFERTVLDLSVEVREVANLIASSIPKKVELQFDLATKLPAIEADRAQIQQLTMNLVINAAEAVGSDVGEVVVSTYVMRCSGREPVLRFPPDGLPEGEYVTLEVRDSGCGMDEATIARIFDPFFTTKFTGRGLGLAAVLGIVRAHAGGLKVASTPGSGTTFRVVFPVSSVRTPSAATTPVSGHTGRATVLVIDDEMLVLELADNALTPQGFDVMTALGGDRGLALFAENERRIDVVLLDLTMPRRGGREILAEMRRIRPDVRILLTSGYSEVEVSRQFAANELAGFVQKPFSPRTLAAKLRDVLGKT